MQICHHHQLQTLMQFLPSFLEEIPSKKHYKQDTCDHLVSPTTLIKSLLTSNISLVLLFLVDKMSITNHFLDLSEKLCYVQCSYCTTILLVSVPCSCLLKTVTVRCGHCSGLLSVNMTKASFVPLHLLTSFEVDKQIQELPVETPPLMHPIEEDDVDDKDPVPTVVNKPPEKRQRAPSAYNHFIKEEIRRLKAREPNMTHKEAFSTAAKNWAHFPRVQYKVDGEGCSQGERKETKDGDIDEVDIQTNGFRERKASNRH